MKAFIMIIITLLLLLLTACAGQGVRMKVETSDGPCGNKSVDFKTDYQVEELEIGRIIQGEDDDGSGCGGGYSVKLGKGTTHESDPKMWEFLEKMMDRIAPGGNP